MSRVPVGDVVRTAGEDSCLGDSEEEPCGKKSFIAANYTHQGHHDPPQYSDCGDYTKNNQRKFPVSKNMVILTPDPWRCIFQGHVCRNFKDDVGNEEDCQGNVVLIARHAQISFKISESCIADVAS